MVNDHTPRLSRRNTLRTIGTASVGAVVLGSGTVLADEASTTADGPRRSERDTTEDWASAHTAEMVTTGDLTAQRCDPDPDRDQWRNTVEIFTWTNSWDDPYEDDAQVNRSINRGRLEISVSGDNVNTNMNLSGDFIGGYESEDTIDEGPCDIEEAVASAAESIVTAPFSTTASVLYSAFSGYINNDSIVTNHDFELRWEWEEDADKLPYETARWAQVDVYLDPGESATISVDDQARIDPTRSGWMYTENSFEFDITAPTTDCDDLQ